MKRSSQITFLIAVTFIGLAIFKATANEPTDKPQPVQAKPPQRIAAKPSRMFGNLLYKGQTVTRYKFRQEFPTGYQYQVRVVNNDQKKKIEEIVAKNGKELEEYESRIAEVEKQMREATNREEQTELRKTHKQLRESFKSTPLPADIRYSEFYTISDVGGDYVGFERNGVETFHRLSSIHSVIYGVEFSEE